MVVAIVPFTIVPKRVAIVADVEVAELLLIVVAVQELLQPAIRHRVVLSQEPVFQDEELARI